MLKLKQIKLNLKYKQRKTEHADLLNFEILKSFL